MPMAHLIRRLPDHQNNSVAQRELRRAPTPAVLTNAVRLAHVHERAAAVVSIQAVTQLRKVFGPDCTDEPIEVAIAVIVTEGRSHPVALGPHARVPRRVHESAGAVIPQESTRAEVGRESQLGPAIVVEIDEAGREPVGA